MQGNGNPYENYEPELLFMLALDELILLAKAANPAISDIEAMTTVMDWATEHLDIAPEATIHVQLEGDEYE